MNDRSPQLSFALELAAAAGNEAMRRFHATVAQLKNDGSVVTDADIAVETGMRRRIRERYPSHGIIGEEQGQTLGNEAFQWVLDPIDGTSWFALGVPRFGTLIALLKEGRPHVSVIHFPVTRETLFAEAGVGCWRVRDKCAAERVRVDGHTRALATAAVGLAGVDFSELRGLPGPRNCRLGRLIRSAGQIEFDGSGCVLHVLVARGLFHAALDQFAYPWDSAAAILCVREAGGVVSTVRGNYDDVVFGGSLLTSCDARLHEAILEAING